MSTPTGPRQSRVEALFEGVLFEESHLNIVGREAMMLRSVDAREIGGITWSLVERTVGGKDRKIDMIRSIGSRTTLLPLDLENDDVLEKRSFDAMPELTPPEMFDAGLGHLEARQERQQARS